MVRCYVLYVFANYAEMENCPTVDASASAGFEHLQSMKEFDIVDEMKESSLLHPIVPMDLREW